MSSKKPATPVHYGLRLNLGGAPSTWHVVIGTDGEPMPGLYHPDIVSPLEELGLTEAEGRRLAEVGGDSQGVEFVEVPKGKLTASREALNAAMNRGRQAARNEGRRRPGEHDYRASDEWAATAAAAQNQPTAPSSVEVDPTPVVTGESTEPVRENVDPDAEAAEEGDTR